MRGTRSRLAGAVVLTAGLALAPAAGDPGDEGARLLLPFKQDLKQALQQGMAQGPAAAVDACRVQAPEIARAQSHDGVRVGRTSHRLRNPANAPPAWVQPLLEAYVADPSQRTGRALPIAPGRMGYVEPITVQPLCLTCHGESLPGPVAARIAELYPDDEAVGFRNGDFRGLFWVEYPAGDASADEPSSNP